jgi:peptidoglycan-associated lipoprotein
MSNPEYTALIEGHADEQGTREYNLALGARRASSVRDYLVAAGVPDARLRTISYGKERPLEICSEESCYMQNRRAVTVISRARGSDPMRRLCAASSALILAGPALAQDRTQTLADIRQELSVLFVELQRLGRN